MLKHIRSISWKSSYLLIPLNLLGLSILTNLLSRSITILWFYLHQSIFIHLICAWTYFWTWLGLFNFDKFHSVNRSGKNPRKYYDSTCTNLFLTSLILTESNLCMNVLLNLVLFSNFHKFHSVNRRGSKQ